MNRQGQKKGKSMLKERIILPLFIRDDHNILKKDHDFRATKDFIDKEDEIFNKVRNILLEKEGINLSLNDFRVFGLI